MTTAVAFREDWGTAPFTSSETTNLIPDRTGSSIELHASAFIPLMPAFLIYPKNKPLSYFDPSSTFALTSSVEIKRSDYEELIDSIEGRITNLDTDLGFELTDESHIELASPKLLKSVTLNARYEGKVQPSDIDWDDILLD